MSHRISALTPVDLWSRVFYATNQLVLGLLFRTVYRMSLADMRPMPDGPLIVAANHRSFLDPLVLAASVERRLTYIMHGKYYDLPALNWYFRAARCIVTDGAANSRQTLREAQQVLQAGHALGIFPEGHISDDGKLQPAQPGTAWLARHTGAPVVPMHIGGTREVLRKGDKRLHLSRVTVAVGDAMSIADYPKGRAGDESFTRDLMAAIGRLGELRDKR